MISYTVPNDAQRMTIGVQGEHNVRQFLFDVTSWRQLTGNIGAAEMVVQRNGDVSPYAAVITMKDANTVSWVPTETDTAKAGSGKIQLMWIASGQTVKTKIFDMKVDPSLDYAVPDSSLDPWESWMPNLLNADARISGLEKEITTISQQLTSPFNFKGDVADYAALVAIQNPEQNDTYYVADLMCRYSWTGANWEQSSLSESDYTDLLSGLRNDFTNSSGLLTLNYSDGYIKTDGATVDINQVVTTSNYEYAVTDCSAGDKIILSCAGATEAKAWCFIDENGNVLSVSETNASLTNDIITAPTGSATFITNNRKEYNPSPFALKVVDSIYQDAKPFLSGFKYVERIPQNSDLNDYTSPGNYSINTYADAQTMSNMPPKKLNGRLTVMCLYNASTIVQIFITGSGLTYTRAFSGGSWKSWITNSDFLSYTNVIAVSENEDLNDYVNPGEYLISDGSTAETIAHTPINLGGRLTVITMTSATTVLQVYITTTAVMYLRAFSSGEWRSWSLLNNDNSIMQLHYDKAVEIPENSNIDNYVTPGNYMVVGASTAVTISGLPVKLGGRLFVLTLYSAGSYHQIYISSQGDWYVREYIRGEWRDWKHFVGEDVLSEVSQGAQASKGAYNALQVLIKSSPYNMAFANAYAPMSMLNYLGNNQNVHPKVLYFSSGFGGHKFWMVYTPYPNSDNRVENPCVAYSDDGYNWINISGNPLSEPSGGGEYNSDAHLVYNSTSSKLECWYRRVGPSNQSPREEIILRRTSSDGVTWAAEETVYTNSSGSYAKLLSPAIICDGTTYHIWVVFGGTRIDYYTAPVSNVSNWTFVRSITLSYNDDGMTVYPWHIDVIVESGTYIMLVMCRKNEQIEGNRCSLFITTSSDNSTYTTPYKVVGGADNWDQFMYRSSIVKVDTIYRIYYSAGSGGVTSIYNNKWYMGITESSSLSNFIGEYA